VCEQLEQGCYLVVIESNQEPRGHQSDVLPLHDQSALTVTVPYAIRNADTKNTLLLT